MSELSIPKTPEDLTPEWLTAALRETETIKTSTVTAFDVEPDIGAGFGLMGQLARLALRYDQPEPEPDAPASLIAKFPTYAPDNRGVADVLRFYETEIRFYEEIADEIELRTPRRYYSAKATDSTDFILLLEDLAPAQVGDQVAGCSIDQAELVIRELATFHAAWWEDPRLADMDWLIAINDPVRVQAAQDLYEHAWGPCQENLGHLLPPEIVELGEAFGAKLPQIIDLLANRPFTISHGDYRLDNLFFASPDGGAPLTVIDWQIMSTARGPFDFAYFMAGALAPAERKVTEMDLLRTYHGILTDRGVQGYGFDQCLLDYRTSMLFCWQYAVVISTLNLTNERGLALATGYMERTVAAITDLNAVELMPS
jgi:aminoglycoside/choline kinase family phosphotransferase